MDVLRLDVQDVGGPCGGHSSSLLHDEGHGVALIEQSELKRVKGVLEVSISPTHMT